MKKLHGLVVSIIVGLLVAGCGQKNTGNAPASTASTPAVEQAASKPPTTKELYEQASEFRDGLHGVAVNKARALELFTQAANMGDSYSMFFVGVMYENGEGVSPDPQKAIEWYEKSDKAGCTAAAPRMAQLKTKLAKKAAKPATK